MPICASRDCGSRTAELKCARCIGVFYCNAACQHNDWKRHKPFCKRAPAEPEGSAAADSGGSPAVTPSLQLADVSTNPLDLQLEQLVSAFLAECEERPKAIKKGLPDAIDKMKALLGKGARPDVRMHTLPAPLLVYMVQSRSPVVEPLLKVLLEAKLSPPLNCNVAAVFPDGSTLTAIYGAICSGQLSSVRMLVAAGASVTQPCSVHAKGRTMWPVEVCYSRIGQEATQIQMLDLLIELGAHVDAHDHLDKGATSPLLLCTSGVCGCTGTTEKTRIREQFALRLIDAGADLTVRDNDQRRPLDHAARFPTLTLFNKMVAKGADPSPVPNITVENAFWLPLGDQAAGASGRVNRYSHYLEWAIYHEDRADVLEAAAAAGVKLKKVKTLDYYAFPLLASACLRSSVACTRFLLDHGVDVNQPFKARFYRSGGTKHRSSKMTATDAAISGMAGVITNHATRADYAAMLAGCEVIYDLVRAAGGMTYEELQQEGDSSSLSEHDEQ